MVPDRGKDVPGTTQSALDKGQTSSGDAEQPEPC